MCLLVGVGIAGVAVSAGSAIYQGVNASNQAGFAQGEASTVFGEQQNYAQQLAALIADPTSVSSLPGYGFQFGQGEQAVQRSMAASGFGGSGNEAAALVQYGQGFAQSAYGQQESLLASLAGLTAPSSPSQLTGAAVGANANANSNVNNSLGNLGYILKAAGVYGTPGSTTTPGQDAGAAALGGQSTFTLPGTGGYVYNNPVSTP